MNKTRFRFVARAVGMLIVNAALAGCLGGSEGDAEKSSVVGSGDASPPIPGTPTTPTTTNRAPEISGVPPVAAQVGKIYAFTPTASDADNDFLEFEVTNKPSWAQFSVETGALNGTPTASDVGPSQDITITVTDGREKRAIGPFKINVAAAGTTTPPNTPPQIQGAPGTTADSGVLYQFQPTATDADGDVVTYSISNRPTWLTFSTTTGLLRGTPTTSNVGDYNNVVVTASDGKATTSLPAFNIKVRGPQNSTPTISGAPGTTVQVAQAYSFQPTGADADGDTLTYSITNRPTWATFNTTTGRLSGTPAAGNVGAFSNIVIRVSDGRATASLAAFTITVAAAPNTPPVVSGTPPTTARVGSAYSFQPTASDVNSDTLAWSIQNLPSWATFSTTTGRLSGTPSATGTTSGIVISVSDGKAATSLTSFAITVSAAPNTSPVISGTPPTTATAGVAYVFQPSASDANGDTLAWSIDNRPSWATFNTATGRLTGTPSAAGVASNIVIRVSDGTATASLAAFSITTSAAPTPTTGSATLSWQAPTQNTDGSSLSNLAGYRIMYGTSASALTQTVQIANAGTTTYQIDNLASGTWYFAVRSYTTGGVESSNSGVASKTIQ